MGAPAAFVNGLGAGRVQPIPPLGTAKFTNADTVVRAGLGALLPGLIGDSRILEL